MTLFEISKKIDDILEQMNQNMIPDHKIWRDTWPKDKYIFYRQYGTFMDQSYEQYHLFYNDIKANDWQISIDLEENND